MAFFGVVFVLAFLGWFIYMIPRSIHAGIQQKKEQELAWQSQSIMKQEFNATLSKIGAYSANMSTCVFEDRALIFSVNTKEKIAYFSTSTGIVKTVPTSKIIGSEIRKNGKTVKANGMNEALAGALIGGRTGAVVGAVLAEEQTCVTRYDLVIRLSDIRDSSVVYHIITQDTSENSPTFNRAQRFAERACDIVYAIVNENRAAQRQTEAAPVPSAPRITAQTSNAPTITAPEAGATIKKVICPNCESVQPVESRFCSNCGHKLEFSFAQMGAAEVITTAAAAQETEQEGNSSPASQDLPYAVVASGLIRCKKCGRTQSSKNASCWMCGQSFSSVKPAIEAVLTEGSSISAQNTNSEQANPVKLIDVDVQSGIGFCPKCMKKQKLGLEKCSNCGQPFITDV